MPSGVTLGFWIFMLVMALLCPAAMIVFGRRFRDKPPEKVNGAFGYRTERSMKNRETWEFAHTCFGALWLRYGIVLLPVSVILMAFSIGKDMAFIGYYGLGVVILQMVIAVIPMFVVEGKLKQTFDEAGRRR